MEEVKRQRNSFVDMGLVVALSAFVCVLIHGLLFGMTWIGMLWMGLAVAYVVMVCWLKCGHGKMKLMTWIFLVLSAAALVGVVVTDDIQRPVMHEYEGVGDTISDYSDRQAEEVEMPVLVSLPEVPDSVAADMSDGGEVAADSMSVDKGENEVEDMERSDTLSNKV